MRTETRLADLVGAVVRQAMKDYGVGRVALLDDGTPEAALATRLLDSRLPSDALILVSHDARVLDSLLHGLGPEHLADDVGPELLRLRARILDDSVAASPRNKTALLLGGPLPPEPLLPLGDLYASEVETLTGDWSAPPAVRSLADRVGGIAELDRILRNWAEGRSTGWSSGLHESVRSEIGSALEVGVPPGSRVISSRSSDHALSPWTSTNNVTLFFRSETQL